MGELQAALAKAWNLTCWSVYPVGVALWYLAVAIIFVLRLLYRPVAFLLLPFLYLGRFVLASLALPFRIAAKFETLYIYLGVAALVGLFGGLIVGVIFVYSQKLLKLDYKPASSPQGRTVKQYREQKQREKQKLKEEMPPLSAGYVSPTLLSAGHLSPTSPSYASLSDGTSIRRRRKGLISQTIMEEDSDF